MQRNAMKLCNDDLVFIICLTRQQANLHMAQAFFTPFPNKKQGDHPGPPVISEEKE
jgi:hypothetical protein